MMIKCFKIYLVSFLLAVFVLIGASPVFAQKNPAFFRYYSKKAASRKATPFVPKGMKQQIRLSIERNVAVETFWAHLLETVKFSSSSQILQTIRLSHLSLQTPAVSNLRPDQLPFPGKEQIDGVIFDMDGTLLDSLPAWDHSASNFLRSQGIEPEEGLDEEIAQLSLYAGAKIMKQRYALPQSVQEIMDLTLAPILEHYRTDIQAKPGVVELLESLHAQGIKIGVATASDKKFALVAFERLGLKKYIRYITSCDEVGVGKRNPAVYDVTADRMGTTKERTLVVEDALYALETAKKAGYLTAGVAEPYHSIEHARAVSLAGDYFIQSFLDGFVWKN